MSIAAPGTALTAPPVATPGEGIAWFEKVLVVAALCLLFGLFKVVLSGSDGRTEGNAAYQLTALALYGSALLLLLIHGMPAWLPRVLLRAMPIILLTLLAVASTIWSQAPDATFRRAISLVLSSAFAIYLVGRVPFRQSIQLIVIAFGIFLVVSIAAVATGVGITGGGNYGGAWRGLAGNKNDFGRTVALTVTILFMAAAAGMVKWRTLTFLAVGVALVVLYFSRSATSLASSVAGIGGGTILYLLLGGRIGRLQFKPEMRVILAVIAVASAIIFVTIVFPLFLEAMGRDPTLTGRTKLWDWAIALNHDRQWLGSGYRAFWIDDNTKYFFESFAWNKTSDGDLSDSYAGPTHAHSGYVDLWLEFGVLGVALYAVFFVSALAQITRALARGFWQEGLLFSVLVVYIHVYAFTARSILQQAEELWFLFTFLYLATIRAGLGRQLPAK